MNKFNKKIVVIGAGPSGLAFSLYLAKNYPELLKNFVVLEKDKFPREKLCGGMITPEGVKTLNSLGFYDLPFDKYSEVSFQFANKKVLYKSRNYGIIADRMDFDYWLFTQAKKAGVNIIDNCKVINISEINIVWNIETTCGNFQSDYIVGADGVKGITSKIIAKKGRIVPLTIEKKSFTGKNELLFDFSVLEEGIKGYFWSFVANGTVNRGIYSSVKSGIDRKYKYGSAEHLYEFGNPLWKDGLLLVGERIGVDPLLGEGIAPAFGTGVLAAKEIVSAIKSNSRNFSYYDSAFYSSFTGRKLRFNSIVAKRLYGVHSLYWASLLTENKMFRYFVEKYGSYGELNQHPLEISLAVLYQFYRFGLPKS